MEGGYGGYGEGEAAGSSGFWELGREVLEDRQRFWVICVWWED